MRWGRPRLCVLCTSVASLLLLLAILGLVAYRFVWWPASTPQPPPEVERPVDDRDGDDGLEEEPHWTIKDWQAEANNASQRANNASQGEEESGPLFPYIIDEAGKCPAGKAPPFLVLLVTVEASQVDRRDAIRRTWGNESQEGVLRLFLLGVKPGELGRLQQSALESESLEHRDIIQQDFVDSYNNLTLKTLMGLNWVATRCPRASFVMKTDSDVFVNSKYLVHNKLLRLKPGVKNYITGGINRGTEPIRDKGHKWYVSEEEYPGHTYPAYPDGQGYVFSGHLAAEIYGASLNTPHLHIEDVHVGVCLAKLGIELTPPLPNEFNRIPVPWSRRGYSRLVTKHNVSPDDMLEFWSRLQR